MIAYLVGQPRVQGNSLIMLVHGVGYGVAVGARTIEKLISLAEVELWIYTHVREETLDLYGFLNPEDKELFKILLSVSGVGPRTALSIMDYGAQPIIEAVQTANVAAFSAVPRVGKKLAQKIIIELKSKLGSIEELHLGPKNQIEADVAEALQSLGFNDRDIHQALQKMELMTGHSSGELIKQAIKIIGHRA